MAKKQSPKLPIPQSGAWTFKSKAVAEDFDRHVREQLPWYDMATGLVVHVARHFIPEGGTVVDVGASTGNIGNALRPVLDQRRAAYLPIDSSPDMAAEYRGPGTLTIADARTFEFPPSDLVVCFLVLMFLPVADRAALIEKIFQTVRPGGAMVIFDKIEPSIGQHAIVSQRLTLAAKYEAGASPEEIIRKELSLAGVQRPLRNGELSIGFVQLFRFGDFAGWLRCA